VSVKAVGGAFARTWERGWERATWIDHRVVRRGGRARSMPFRAGHEGREAVEAYIRWSFDDERRSRWSLAGRWGTATRAWWSIGSR